MLPNIPENSHQLNQNDPFLISKNKKKGKNMFGYVVLEQCISISLLYIDFYEIAPAPFSYLWTNSMTMNDDGYHFYWLCEMIGLTLCYLFVFPSAITIFIVTPTPTKKGKK